MTQIIEENGTITISFTKKPSAPDADEETLVFWLFKVLRQFGLAAEIESESGNIYTEEEVLRDL